ncbi:hypothetical protein LWM68_41310 [Niabella sp. W65]|nr:hypothetical protein [Niabella sp. W65]MCH7368612.1 hypothetical protein [Niabella sp. W65]
MDSDIGSIEDVPSVEQVVNDLEYDLMLLKPYNRLPFIMDVIARIHHQAFPYFDISHLSINHSRIDEVSEEISIDFKDNQLITNDYNLFVHFIFEDYSYLIHEIHILLFRYGYDFIEIQIESGHIFFKPDDIKVSTLIYGGISQHNVDLQLSSLREHLGIGKPAEEVRLTILKDDSLKEVFPLIRIEKFKLLEDALFSRKWLSSNRKWQGSKEDLATLIDMLLSAPTLNPWIRKMTGSTAQARRSRVRSWFEDRYGINIAEQFKPSKLKRANKIIEAILANLLISCSRY